VGGAEGVGGIVFLTVILLLDVKNY